MFRLLFLLATIIFAWFIINAIMRGIIITLRGHRSQRQTRQNRPTVSTRQQFDDIKDAEYTDITDEKK